LAAVRTDIGRQKQKISATAAKLDGEHRRLSSLYERKKQLQRETEDQRQETARRLQAMAAEAEDLRDLLARLEQERKRREQEAVERAAAERAAREAEKAAAKAARDAEIAAAKAAREAEAAARKAAKEQHEAEIAAARQAKLAEQQASKAAKEAVLNAEKAAREAEAAARKAGPAAAHLGPAPWSRPFSQAEGEMPFPARGRIVGRFGQAGESGSVARGVSIETRAGAQVVSPYDGQVVFAGPFRGYGLLLIIEHGEGYHTLLAGMARIDSNVGQHLLPGEPVGVMGPDGATGQSESKPVLYVELRRNGQPVNPLPWFTAHKTKVSG
jgi:septal ring factor EnvC (AmiA/AmiB activator)